MVPWATSSFDRTCRPPASPSARTIKWLLRPRRVLGYIAPYAATEKCDLVQDARPDLRSGSRMRWRHRADVDLYGEFILIVKFFLRARSRLEALLSAHPRVSDGARCSECNPRTRPIEKQASGSRPGTVPGTVAGDRGGDREKHGAGRIGTGALRRRRFLESPAGPAGPVPGQKCHLEGGEVPPQPGSLDRAKKGSVRWNGSNSLDQPHLHLFLTSARIIGC